eukprot:gb/GFBE01071905.1/.p1 GENE.gb/GFBE01071905.1/~~gb/GFBE01071905.1/.p1  ORF type:complete len:176 (+),score=17.55 gb/GFBE01071905.1/:1-528(+)
MWTCARGALRLCGEWTEALSRPGAGGCCQDLAQAPPLPPLPPPPGSPAPPAHGLRCARSLDAESRTKSNREEVACDSRKEASELSDLKRQVASLREQLAAVTPTVDAAASGTGAATRGGADSECVVCMVSARSYAFTPCGHRCVCHMCAVGAVRADRRCPICRAKVVRILKIIDP